MISNGKCELDLMDKKKCELDLEWVSCKCDKECRNQHIIKVQVVNPNRA